MPGGLTTPSLAESWTMSKDGLTCEFVLRKGIRFHNGDPVTGEDVKFSFERYQGGAAKLLKEKVREVQVADPGRVPKDSNPCRQFQRQARREWREPRGASSTGLGAALVRRRLTPGLISSLPATAGSPPFISFSTSYPELDSAVRRPMLRIGKRREEYFAVAQAALLEAKHRKSIGNPGERRLSPWATGKRAVCWQPGSNPETAF
jgi:hypothetical protein